MRHWKLLGLVLASAILCGCATSPSDDSPKRLFLILRTATVARDFETMYDRVLSHKSRQAVDRKWETIKAELLLKHPELLDPKAEAQRIKALKPYGVTTLIEFDRLTGRDYYIQRSRRLSEGKALKGMSRAQLLQVEIAPGRLTGSMTIRALGGAKERFQIVFEGGAWHMAMTATQRPAP